METWKRFVICVYVYSRKCSFFSDRPTKACYPARFPVIISRISITRQRMIKRGWCQRRKKKRKKHCDMEYAELMATYSDNMKTDDAALRWVCVVCECVFSSRSNGDWFARITKTGNENMRSNKSRQYLNMNEHRMRNTDSKTLKRTMQMHTHT